MHDILLVIGSIDSMYYTPIMHIMRAMGMNPRIVHIGTEFCCESDFYNAASEHIPTYFSEGRAEAFAEGWVTTKKDFIVNHAFLGHSIESVKAVIRFEDSNTCDRSVYMGWLLDVLPDDRAEYIVRKGDNGALWVDDTDGLRTHVS